MKYKLNLYGWSQNELSDEMQRGFKGMVSQARNAL
jgi:hypothetical protein